MTQSNKVPIRGDSESLNGIDVDVGHKKSGRRFKKRYRRLDPRLTGILAVIVIGIIVQGIVGFGFISPLLVPQPTKVLLSISRLVEVNHLIDEFGATLSQLVGALAIALTLGVSIGYLLHRVKALGVAYTSWLAALFAAPIILLYPLFLVIFGRNFVTIIVTGAITGIIPVIIHVKEGLDCVSLTLVNVGRSFNISNSGLFWKILLPAATPTIFVGIRLCTIYGLVNIVGLEYLIDYGGLGKLVSDLNYNYDIAGMYAAVGFIFLLSALFLGGFHLLEKKMRMG